MHCLECFQDMSAPGESCDECGTRRLCSETCYVRHSVRCAGEGGGGGDEGPEEDY